MTWGKQNFHPVWRKILPTEILDFQPPSEKKADCLNCPKIKSNGFRPGVKCCTYHPKVPNYMLGYALESESSAIITKLIAKGFLLPEGSGHTPLQWLEVMRLDQSREYGKSEKVVCDFLDRDRGLCGIYQYRNSACSTYFCMYDEKWGENFWERLHHLMARCELALTQIVLKEIDFDFAEYLEKYDRLSSLSPMELCDPATKAWRPSVLETLWGKHFGNEEAFFKNCSRALDGLSSPWQRICDEKLIRPNIVEISSMEHEALEDDNALLPFADVFHKLQKFIERVEGKS